MTPQAAALFRLLYRFLDTAATAAGWFSWLWLLLVFTTGVPAEPWLVMVLFWWAWGWVEPPDVGHSGAGGSDSE